MARPPVTHALTMNGRIHGELKDALDPDDVLLRRRLALLDGIRRYSLSLWELPPETPFERVDLGRWPTEYVQAAGSRDRLTVELRRTENSGPCQYVVGRTMSGPEPQPTVSLPWDGVTTTVLANEVLDLDEAAAVFIRYLSDNGIPEGFALRRLDL
ncbi:hypothetical protein [Terrabacter sp. Soil811]|uniref:hypothetical protein n=1 Tax=Terrabacter sp. Soil811 TaxID=1736419 RepID=UPI000A98702D|nr:hypothetical protein [Terrabacter sp. Soil811]